VRGNEQDGCGEQQRPAVAMEDEAGDRAGEDERVQFPKAFDEQTEDVREELVAAKTEEQELRAIRAERERFQVNERVDEEGF
jgi:hypothetical protein